MARKVAAIGPYYLGDELGRGFFGRVHKALNIETGDFVAIKTISLASYDKNKFTTIEREIDTLKQLNHKHIVKYLNFIKQKNELHIILEFIENGSLYDIIKRFGNFPETLIQVYAKQVLEALVYLHENGIIHRDIKASNILITKSGECKLADFGTCLNRTNILNDPESLQFSLVGSPYWMSPELVSGSPDVSFPTDIWSFGCTLIELLTGLPPWGKLDPMAALFKIHAQNINDYPLPPDCPCSVELREFIDLCCERDVKKRPTAKKLLNHPWLKNRIESKIQSRLASVQDLKILLDSYAEMASKNPQESPYNRTKSTIFIDINPKNALSSTPVSTYVPQMNFLPSSLPPSSVLSFINNRLKLFHAEIESSVTDTKEQLEESSREELIEMIKIQHESSLQVVEIGKELNKEANRMIRASKKAYKKAEEYRTIAEQAVLDRKLVLETLKKVENNWAPSESIDYIHKQKKDFSDSLSNLILLQNSIFPSVLASYIYGCLSINHLRTFSSIEATLLKQSVKTSTSGQIRKSPWRTRLFMLVHDFLIYFKADKDTNPAGVIHLDRFKLSDVTPDSNNKVAKIIRQQNPNDYQLFFLLKCKKALYIINARSNNAKQTWMDAITNRVAWYKHPNVNDFFLATGTLHSPGSAPPSPSPSRT